MRPIKRDPVASCIVGFVMTSRQATLCMSFGPSAAQPQCNGGNAFTEDNDSILRKNDLTLVRKR
jgi:hypothetical protein